MISVVSDPSQVGEARRAASELARTAGMAEAQRGKVALVATEMATNLLKHAGGGLIVIAGFDDADGDGVQLLALDKGPGMAQAQRCIADGFSTAGTAGTGLGAIARQADRFALFSRPGRGTAVLARFRKAAAGKRGAGERGDVVAAYPGETVSGDGWCYAAEAGETLLLADGSGHGPHAALAAEVAVRAFREHSEADCIRLAEILHRALRQTRGAAIAIARIDATRRLVRYVGIGNISGTLVAGAETRRMVSHNGTAGHIAPKIREFTYAYEGVPLVLLHSDGISAKWDLAAYPGLAASHPALIAGILFRDFRRERDDACIVAMRGSA
jgi:anti-sigma regulatory factor (Ser/Thr protein kinase)